MGEKKTNGGIPPGTEHRGAKLAHEIASTGHQKDNPAANMRQKGKMKTPLRLPSQNYPTSVGRGGPERGVERQKKEMRETITINTYKPRESLDKPSISPRGNGTNCITKKQQTYILKIRTKKKMSKSEKRLEKLDLKKWKNSLN